jgi:hypothetical protein
MSCLAWIDFDEAERHRAQRIMALYQEREGRDELGLGAIRECISDHLIPGASTIQTGRRDFDENADFAPFLDWYATATLSSLRR